MCCLALSDNSNACKSRKACRCLFFLFLLYHTFLLILIYSVFENTMLRKCGIMLTYILLL